MRRFVPILIVVIGSLALAIDFWPGLKLPTFGDPAAGPRVLETKLGLDLQGGLRVEYQAIPVDGKSPDAAAMATIRDIIERRVNSTGVSEPVVVVHGNGPDRRRAARRDRPGRDPNGSSVRPVSSTFVPLPPDKYGTASTTGSATGIIDGQPLPKDDAARCSRATSSTAPTRRPTRTAGRRSRFALKSDAAKKFADYTTANVGNFFAIVLDGTVDLGAEHQRARSPAGPGQITTGFGADAATQMNELVTVLRYGSLPFPIQEVQDTPDQRRRSARSSSSQSLIAGRDRDRPRVHASCSSTTGCRALVADFALVYYALVVLAIFRLIPVTLTLAGIAGFVLSVGMAVDANILIFERTQGGAARRQDPAAARSRPASTGPGTRSSTRTCRA